MNSTSTPATPSIAEQAIAAVVATAASPNAVTIMSDLYLAMNIYSEYKAKTNGLHPTALQILQLLI
jgi:hypothetical protein